MKNDRGQARQQTSNEKTNTNKSNDKYSSDHYHLDIGLKKNEKNNYSLSKN
jgi:hypothetical protein